MTRLLAAIATFLSTGGDVLAQEAKPERPERLEGANPPESPAGATASDAAAPWRVLPGLQPDGRVQLPNQWSLRPAGPQVEVGDFPVNVVLNPACTHAAVVHSGHGTHEVIVVDVKTRSITCRVPLPQTFYGGCFSPDGSRLFVSGGEEDVVHSFAFAKGLLSDGCSLRVVDPATSFVTTGIGTTEDGSRLLVCGSWGGKLAITDAKDVGDARLIDLGKGTYPYAAVADRDDPDRAFVSLWGGAAVATVDLKTGDVKERWATPSHPTEMVQSPRGHILYVACSNSTKVAAIDTSTGRTMEVIDCALYPGVPSGNTPQSVSLNADGTMLAVANADANNIAIFDVSEAGHARSTGFVPAGWYPTSVRFLPDGSLVYANGKGVMPRSNRHGPNPLVSSPGGVREYIGGLMRGTLGFVKSPNAKSMERYTREAYAATPLRRDAAARAEAREADNPIPASIGGKSPIRHVIYVIKENRTYDQVFGDMSEGKGDANLCLFPERVTPNHHALAREFVLLDNFYVDGEVSADGHEWSMGAYATDFVEKTWPLTYRGSRPKHRELAYPSEGAFAIADGAGGHLWDRCKEAGVTYRSYGEWVENGPTADSPGTAKADALEGHFDPMFRSFDMDYPDVRRAERFLAELKRFEAEGDMPQLCIVRLPNDHTAGTRAGSRTPTACVADNDLAMGMVVEGVSKSKFWPSTAIFVVEDDAQNGSDHVDAHRTVALAISPYSRRGSVDSSLYSTSSMLRTIELILGLQPMSQFDAAALPMYRSFRAQADTRPYAIRPPVVDVNERNVVGAWGAEMSAEFDLAKEDAADDLLLNEVVWKSVKGPDSPMPPPVRAAFLFEHRKDDDD